MSSALFRKLNLSTASYKAKCHASRSLSAIATSSKYGPDHVDRRMGQGGPGGRASDANLKVAVFGASGFLGNYLCAELGGNGFTAYLANRGDDLEMRHLKIPFDLGRVRFVFYSPRDQDSIREVIANADVVVNLIGKYYESGRPAQTKSFPYLGYKINYSYHDANVVIPRTIAEICADMQVDHLVHVSSASASPNAMSEWSRTKYEGEMAVKKAFPWAIIVRPTQMFGRQDFLMNWFALASKSFKCVPLLDGGHKLTQPVFVGDVARTILRAIDSASVYEGKQIDCFGTAEFTYRELAEFVNDITERNKPIVEVPYWWYKQMAKVLQYRRDPLVVPDLVDVWAEDFLPTLAPEDYANEAKNAGQILTMSDFDIKATPMEKVMFEFLQVYRYGGHYYSTEGYR